ncbi:hypothetical protein Bca52824_047267 [Brassica carinata]|uniref:Uncharacterized protein n=1 Tax=Brassica carinata TaxID=52824 RepID=A0A8X7REC2_BRACI|nr:hypothetical protein Bca52824_047267 [Brassica carinata]
MNRVLVSPMEDMIRDERADRVEVGSSDVSSSGSEASSQASRSLRRASREIPFDQIDCRPTIYHHGGIFEELGPLPFELLRDPRAQSWGNVFDSCSSHKMVRDLLRRSGGAGVTYIIPSKRQRPWSPPIGYQCVYESYFGDHMKLWFPIPRLITSYAFRRDIAICQLLNGSLRIAVMLMVMAAEIDVSMSVRVFEELTFTKAEPHGIFSVKMRLSYNVLSGHPNKTKDWQRSYFYVKSDEHAFSEPPGDDYRVLWNKMLVRHLNTIAYPEKFFESAQAIVAHSHLRWRDLSREWIRRQEARIARADWESRLPVMLGPRKSRLSLFTRKQQKLLDEARKMDGVRLSALLKGKLQLLSKKSIPADVQGSTSSNAGRASKEGAPGLVDKDVGAEPPASSPKKKKKSKKPRRKATEELPLEEIASLDETSEGLEARKGEKGRKRPYEGATSSIDRGEAPAVGREGATRGSVESDHSETAPEDRSRKKKKKKSVEAEPRPSDTETGLIDVVAGEDVSLETPPEEREVSARGSDPVTGERYILDPSARKGSRLEGSTARRKKIEFPDRVEFSYNETTPLILNPLRCAELTRQIRGGTKEMPQLDGLYFRNEYIDAASSRARSDGSMNFLVEKYDSALKQTMIQLGSSEKLAQTRLKVIKRVRAEHKKANEKAVEEKEILRVKFEELEGKLKSSSAARKELVREKSHLEHTAANLEKEKTELVEERDAAVDKLIRERQRLRDSRGLEVTRERERVEAAMAEKASRRFDRKAKNLYGQASGTRKCLEVIKASGTEIPQEMIDLFTEQEKLYEAEVMKLRVEPLSDSDLTLSPLVLPSRFAEDRFRTSFDPYGLNVNLIGPEMASRLVTSLEVVEEPSEEPLVDVTSIPTEPAKSPVGSGFDERPENENLKGFPGKDGLEKGDTLVREGETENAGVEDPVLVSDSSSEGREDGEEDNDGIEEASLPRPAEEETIYEAGDTDVPPRPVVDSLASIPTRAEDPTAAATKGPDDQDSVL